MISHIQKITTQDDMDSFVDALEITTSVVIIKPNWVCALTGGYTEPKALDMFLTSLQGKKVMFVESYTYWRTDKMAIQGNKVDYFSSAEATLQTGKPHWEFFRQQDENFLVSTGLQAILKKHNAVYLNVTNANWLGEVALHPAIEQLVDNKYAPLTYPAWYGQVPYKLFELKDDATFISFAKAKRDSEYGASLSIKNLFGLIPDPNRIAAGYHGDNDSQLAQSIIDINKIYRSLFLECRFIIDGIFTAADADFDVMKTVPHENWGMIIGGKNAVEVDSIGQYLIQANYSGALAELLAKYSSQLGESADISLPDLDSYPKLPV